VTPSCADCVAVNTPPRPTLKVTINCTIPFN
jgi:hypothetical protein